MSGTSDAEKSLFSTASLLGPRLRRYVTEIDQTISRACSSDPTRDAKLLEIEAVSTVTGLRRHVLELEIERAALRKENCDLQTKIDALHLLETKAAKVATLQHEQENLQSEIQRLQQELLDNTEEYRGRYDELKVVTNKITATANEAMTISEKRQQEVEKLQSEKEGLQAQVEAIKLHLQSLTEEHKLFVDNSEASNAEARQKYDVLEQSLFTARQSHMNQLQEVTDAYQQTINELQASIRKLQKSEASLKSKVTELESHPKSESLKEGSAAALWRQAAKSEMLQQRNTELEEQMGTLAARLAAVTEHAEAVDLLQAQRDKLLILVNEWRNVASIAVSQGSTPNIDSISPERLREELELLLKYKSRSGGHVKHLRLSNLELQSQLEQNKAELRRAQLLLGQERLNRSAAELEAAARAGEADTQRELLETWKLEADLKSETFSRNKLNCGNESKSASSTDQVSTTATATISSPADLNRELAGKISQWRDEMKSLMSKYQEELDSATTQGTLSEEKLKQARQQLITLEGLIDSADLRREELEVVVQRQNKKIDDLEYRITSHSCNPADETSIQLAAPGFRELEAKPSSQAEVLERLTNPERDEAVALYASLQSYYMSEAVVFRAILQVLFGWLVRIDTAPPGQDIIVTLKPAFNFGVGSEKQTKSPKNTIEETTAKDAKSTGDSAPRQKVLPDDSDAALVFVVKSKLPDLTPEDAMRDGYLESLITDMYRDEDFTMHLDGRFAERWETDQSWKNQLTARRSYAAFLAVTVLGEQNRVLQREALASRTSFQPTK